MRRIFRTGALALAAAIIIVSLQSWADSSEERGNDDSAALSAQWWQLVNSVPPADNPNLDITGAKCMVGQRGPVWFLMGTFFLAADTNASRSCDIPQGVSLFFPLANSIIINTPDICGQQGPLTAKQVRQMATQLLGKVSAIEVTIDGKSVADAVARIKSKIFAVAIPGDNIFNAACGGPGTVPAGIYSPSADDGYYAFLPPLDVGSHHLLFSATSTVADAAPITRTISYDLRVVPVRMH